MPVAPLPLFATASSRPHPRFPASPRPTSPKSTQNARSAAIVYRKPLPPSLPPTKSSTANLEARFARIPPRPSPGRGVSTESLHYTPLHLVMHRPSRLLPTFQMDMWTTLECSLLPVQESVFRPLLTGVPPPFAPNIHPLTSASTGLPLNYHSTSHDPPTPMRTPNRQLQEPAMNRPNVPHHHFNHSQPLRAARTTSCPTGNHPRIDRDRLPRPGRPHPHTTLQTCQATRRRPLQSGSNTYGEGAQDSWILRASPVKGDGFAAVRQAVRPIHDDAQGNTSVPAGAGWRRNAHQPCLQGEDSSPHPRSLRFGRDERSGTTQDDIERARMASFGGLRSFVAPTITCPGPGRALRGRQDRPNQSRRPFDSLRTTLRARPRGLRRASHLLPSVSQHEIDSRRTADRGARRGPDQASRRHNPPGNSAGDGRQLRLAREVFPAPQALPETATLRSSLCVIDVRRRPAAMP